MRIYVTTGAIRLCTYLVWALVTTWPMARHLGTALPGPYLTDQSMNLWIVDTFWTQVTAGQSPFFSDRVFVPLGVNMAHIILGWPVALLAGPFWALGQMELFWGLFVIAAVVAAAAGMRAVVFALTWHPWAAFWAGLLYAASPTFLSFVGSPWHFKVAGGAMLPWALWALVRWHETPTVRRLVILSAWTWALVLTDYYVGGMFLALVGPFLLVAWQRRLLPSTLLGAAANLALAALVYQAVPSLDPQDLNLGGGFWGIANSNLRDLFVPGWEVERAGLGLGNVEGSGLWWHGVRAAAWGPEYASDHGPDPDSYYFGLGMAALFVLALVWRPTRTTWGLAAGGVLVVLLSAGTQMRWGETVLATGTHTPWGWIMAHGPTYLQAYDLPRCFLLAGMMALVAVAGCGLARLQRPAWIALVALAIFVGEYARLGIAVSRFPVPSYVHYLAARPDGRTVLELPRGIVESKGGFGFGQTCSVGMYWQTLHRHPTVAAYVSRVPRSTYNYFATTPVIRDLLLMTTPGNAFRDFNDVVHTGTALPTAYPPGVAEDFLRTFNLGYFVLLPDARQADYAAELERVFADCLAEKVAEDGTLLYRVTLASHCGRRSPHD